MLDKITEQEIREYEDYCKQQEAEFEKGLMTHDEAEKYYQKELNNDFSEMCEMEDFWSENESW